MKTIPENKKSETGGWRMSLHGVPVLMTGERALFLPEAPCDGMADGSTSGGTDANTGGTDANTGTHKGGSSGGTPTLILSDTHFGKAETFQEHGIPVPIDHTDRDLDRLRKLVHVHSARRIIILGDLFHSTRNSSWDRVLAGFQSMEEIELILVMGNHDIIHRDDYESIGFTCVPGMTCGPFYLQHHPPDHVKTRNEESVAQAHHPGSGSGSPSPFLICGHIHPSFRIKGSARQRITLPCFWLRPGCLVLPAFGSFTGSYSVPAQPDDLVLLATGDSVIPHSHDPDV